MTERYISPAKLPTPHEREVLTHLVEEASEIIQRATKFLRFGKEEVQPGQSLTNSERLSAEIGNFQEVMYVCKELKLLDEVFIEAGVVEKHKKMKIYMQSDSESMI